MTETNEISEKAAKRIAKVVTLRVEAKRLERELDAIIPPVGHSCSQKYREERMLWVHPLNRFNELVNDFLELEDYLAERELDGLPDVDEFDLKQDHPLTVAG